MDLEGIEYRERIPIKLGNSENKAKGVGLSQEADKRDLMEEMEVLEQKLKDLTGHRVELCCKGNGKFTIDNG